MFIPESVASSQEMNKRKDDETDEKDPSDQGQTDEKDPSDQGQTEEKDPSDQGQEKPIQFVYGWPDDISENLQEPSSDTSFQLNMQKISTPVL